MNSKYLICIIFLCVSIFGEAKTFHVSKFCQNKLNTNPTKFPSSIGSAAILAQPGDTILVHAGTYRERVAPPRGGIKGQPITYMAAPGEEVIVRGSEIWKPDWIKINDQEDVYSTKLDNSLFGSFNPFYHEISMFELMASSSFYKNAQNREADAANNVVSDINVKADKKFTLGQIFINGKMMTEVLYKDEVIQQECSWAFFKTDSTVLVHFPKGADLEKAFVEITTRNRIFAPHIRGLGYINVKGFIFEHCANDAICLPHMVGGNDKLSTGQQGAVSTRSGNHWVIENNVIRLSKTVGLDVGSETTGKTIMDYESESYLTPIWKNVGYHLIRNNVVSDNGIAGIVGIVSSDTEILDNIVERNNLLLYTGHQHAGIKMLLTPNCKVEGNIVQDNECIGIWLDNQVIHSTIKNNFVCNNRRAGIFYELSNGPVMIANNVVGKTRNDFVLPFAPGIIISDAAQVTVKDNIIFKNEDFGLRIRLIPGRKTNITTSGVTELKNIKIAHNIFDQNVLGHVEMPFWGSLINLMSFDSNFYRGKNSFALTAIGQSKSNAIDFIQRNKIIAKYKEAFGATPQILNQNEKPFLRWSVALDFDQWEMMMQLDKGSNCIIYN